MNFQKNKSEGARSEILQEIIHYGEHRKIQSHGWLYFWAPTGALVVTHVQKMGLFGKSLQLSSPNAHIKFMKQTLEQLERMFPFKTQRKSRTNVGGHPLPQTNATFDISLRILCPRYINIMAADLSSHVEFFFIPVNPGWYFLHTFDGVTKYTSNVVTQQW